MKKRVKLEPELEEIAAFWGPVHDLAMAAKFERWVRQLRMRAKITLSDRNRSKRKPELRFVAPRKAALN